MVHGGVKVEVAEAQIPEGNQVSSDLCLSCQWEIFCGHMSAETCRSCPWSTPPISRHTVMLTTSSYCA